MGIASMIEQSGAGIIWDLEQSGGWGYCQKWIVYGTDSSGVSNIHRDLMMLTSAVFAFTFALKSLSPSQLTSVCIYQGSVAVGCIVSVWFGYGFDLIVS